MGNGTRTEPNLRNPGTTAFDSVLSRWQPIRERMRLQFRAEMYNILNIPFLTAQGSGWRTVGSSNFGSTNAAGISRKIQLALKLSW